MLPYRELRIIRSIVLIIGLPLIIITQASGQGLPSGGMGGDGRIEGDFKFMPIPYVNYDRSIGFQLGFIPMAMFNPVKSDTISPSSIGGLMGMYTSNETWFMMGFGMLFLDEDNWRVMGAGGAGNINFQFYLDHPINSWIPYNTKVDFIFTQVQRRVYKKLYFGLSYVYMKMETTTDIIPGSYDVNLNGVGMNVTMDKRKNLYYPRDGFHSKIRYISFPEWFGNDFVSDKIEIEHNQYFPVHKNRDVIAGRVFIGMGIGDLSFNQQFIVGQRDIRGYTQGAFRGNYLLAAQGEYRWNLIHRFSLVGFAGVATVFESPNESDDGKILPGAGAGFRYTVVTDNHMNVGLDIAAGRNDWGIYFRLGEAF